MKILKVSCRYFPLPYLWYIEFMLCQTLMWRTESHRVRELWFRLLMSSASVIYIIKKNKPLFRFSNFAMCEWIQFTHDVRIKFILIHHHSTPRRKYSTHLKWSNQIAFECEAVIFSSKNHNNNRRNFTNILKSHLAFNTKLIWSYFFGKIAFTDSFLS